MKRKALTVFAVLFMALLATTSLASAETNPTTISYSVLNSDTPTHYDIDIGTYLGMQFNFSTLNYTSVGNFVIHIEQDGGYVEIGVQSSNPEGEQLFIDVYGNETEQQIFFDTPTLPTMPNNITIMFNPFSIFWQNENVTEVAPLLATFTPTWMLAGGSSSNDFADGNIQITYLTNAPTPIYLSLYGTAQLQLDQNQTKTTTRTIILNGIVSLDLTGIIRPLQAPITANDALAVGVIFGIVAIVLAITFPIIMYRRKNNDE